MNLNFIPTDSIYKFAGIFGLFITVFAFTYLQEKYWEARESEIEYRALEDIYVLQLQHQLKQHTLHANILRNLNKRDSAARALRMNRIDSLIREVESERSLKLINRIDNLLKEDRTEDSIENAEFRQQDRFWKNQVAKIDSTLKVKAIEVKRQERLLSVKQMKFRAYKGILIGAYLLGPLLSAFGFFHWYRREVHSDRIIKARKTNLKKSKLRGRRQSSKASHFQHFRPNIF